ncbi:hypothetical protein BGX30_004658 [Mortierella sp. GBA39]|nr:hypothetical protein BGX30_004658 [Mortierella sp. GBA39]
MARPQLRQACTWMPKGIDGFQIQHQLQRMLNFAHPAVRLAAAGMFAALLERKHDHQPPVLHVSGRPLMDVSKALLHHIDRLLYQPVRLAVTERLRQQQERDDLQCRCRITDSTWIQAFQPARKLKATCPFPVLSHQLGNAASDQYGLHRLRHFFARQPSFLHPVFFL